MHTARAALVAALLTFTLTPFSAQAQDVDAFADALRDTTGEAYPSWVLTKLTTFKLGPKCWAKLPDKSKGAIHKASFITRDVGQYAKTVTGDDWSAIENQSNSDREKNRATVESMMDAFKSRFGMSITVEGEDCDAGPNALWLRYWGSLVTALKNSPPPSSKVFINLVVSSKIRDVTVDVSADGSTFNVSAPKDIEAREDIQKLERPFRKVASGLTDDFAFGMQDRSARYNPAWVLTKFHTFKLGKQCLAKVADKDQKPLHTASYVTRNILSYAMLVGADDWDRIEGQSVNDPKTNRDIVEGMMDEFAPRLHITVSVEGDDCDTSHDSLWLSYWYEIADKLAKYPPKADKVAITLNVTAKAKKFAVNTGKDGSTFAITAPRDVEAKDWHGMLETAFKKVSRKK